MKIALLNLETGNLNSVKNILSKILSDFFLANSINDLKNTDVIFVAGVSSFDALIQQLKQRDFFNFLKNEKKKKIVGICSGMQVMFASSEEGKLDGLGIFEERLVKFKECHVTVPHVGWNKLITNDNLNQKEFYFCHSYYAPINPKFTYAKTFYSNDFSSIVIKNNFIGIQFHPEKSNENGKNLLSKIIYEQFTF